MTLNKKLCGIDWSLTSPAICVIDGDQLSVMCFSDLKKLSSGKFDNIDLTIHTYPKYTNSIERYLGLSDRAIEFLKKHEITEVNIEGYSYNSVASRVFEIGENTCCLKLALTKENIKFNIVSPSNAKKHATGKGNSNKEAMCDAFREMTGIDFTKYYIIKNNNGSPFNDIADAYHLAKCNDTYTITLPKDRLK